MLDRDQAYSALYSLFLQQQQPLQNAGDGREHERKMGANLGRTGTPKLATARCVMVVYLCVGALSVLYECTHRSSFCVRM